MVQAAHGEDPRIVGVGKHSCSLAASPRLWVRAFTGETPGEKRVLT
jgi:hypothetical protein